MSEKAALLEEMANQSNGKIRFEQALLAAQPNQEVTFHQSETASSVLTEHKENDDFKKVTKKTTTLALLLEKNQIRRIFPLNEKFNHDFHEAIACIESDAAEGVVAQVVQAGYTIGDRLIRPALVGVSKGK